MEIQPSCRHSIPENDWFDLELAYISTS